MKHKMVVFDIDGVLVDIDSSWELINRKYNIDHTANLQRYISGNTSYEEFMRRVISS